MGKVKQSSTVPGVSSHYRRKIVQDLREPTQYLDHHHPRPQLSTFCFFVSGITGSLDLIWLEKRNLSDKLPFICES